MFTGLVQATGAVLSSTKVEGGLLLSVDVSALPGAFRIGDSIALSGVCCTVVTLESGRAEFFLTPETLDRTWLGAAAEGDRLNLEGALRAGEPLGGHIVQGHVDGLGSVTGSIDPEGGDVTLVPRDGLQRTTMFVSGVRWLVDPPAAGEARAAEFKVRARHRPVSGSVVASGDTARVTFDEPVDAITPGQAAVFYRGTRVLGGGWIDGSA